MPTYVYQCKSCEAEFEELKKRKDKDNGPVCCGVHAQRLVSAPAIRDFAGSVGGRWMIGEAKKR